MSLENNSNEVNIETIADFYNEIPNILNESVKWYLHSKMNIDRFINKNKRYLKGDILNAGSGGSTYGLNTNLMTHLDIAEKKISQFKNYVVASVEKMPFENESFDSCICVGSVINYCDAIKTITEISRIIRPNSFIILEFESSYGYEHRFSSRYKQNATIMEDAKMDAAIVQKLKQWIYSPKYIKAILKSENFKIIKADRFHIASSLSYARSEDDNIATNYVKFDKLLRHLWPFKRHASNEIYLCKKL